MEAFFGINILSNNNVREREREMSSCNNSELFDSL